MAPKHRQSNITDNAFPLPFSRIWPIKWLEQPQLKQQNLCSIGGFFHNI
jgi:hypothetical protein